MKTLTLCSTALVLALGAPVFAQTDSSDDVITVTSTRLERPLSETGTSVTVIDQAQLDQTAFALDAIATAPGVTVNQNGSFGGTASVRIRGASSEQTLVLLDGVPVNDPTSPGGGYNFATLDSGSIERIEILRGGQSVLWGSDAIGGVVAITSRRPDSGTGVTGYAEFGSFNTVRGGTAFSGANEQGDFRLSVNAIDTDGISKADEDDGNAEEDGYNAYTLSARGRYDLGFGEISASLRHVDAENEYDSFGFATGVQDGDEVGETTETSGAITFAADHFDGALETWVQVAFADIERENFTNGTSSFSTEGDRLVLRYQGFWNISERHRLAFGAEREDSSANDNDTDINSLFTLLELEPVDGLVLTGGVRHDESDRFGGETTAKAAVSWQASEHIRVFGSAGTGFKAPTIFQTTFFCCGATQPNPDLAAETSEGFDLGADFAFAEGRGLVTATVFDLTVENQISFSSGSYFNIAKVESTGLELAGRYALNSAWSVSGNYTYTDAEDGSGGELVRLPEHAGYAELTYTADRWGGTVSVRHNGEEQDSRGTVDAWTRLDASAHYTVNDRIEIYGRAENLTDEDYQQIFGYGTPGLSGYVGVRLTR